MSDRGMKKWLPYKSLTEQGGYLSEIIARKRGTSGFGYDPVFVPEGFTQTFAEMSDGQKNKISHRALAVGKLCKFLNTL